MKRTNNGLPFAGLLVLFGLLLSLQSVHASPAKPMPYVGEVKAVGFITGVNLGDDETYNVTVETDSGSIFILCYFPQRVASEAGKLIGQEVRITGFIYHSGPNLYWLSHATFAHDNYAK